MKEILFGSWGPQLVVSIKQHPLQVTTAVLIAISLVADPDLGSQGIGR